MNHIQINSKLRLEAVNLSMAGRKNAEKRNHHLVCEINYSLCLSKAENEPHSERTWIRSVIRYFINLKIIRSTNTTSTKTSTKILSSFIFFEKYKTTGVKVPTKMAVLKSFILIWKLPVEIQSISSGINKKRKMDKKMIPSAVTNFFIGLYFTRLGFFFTKSPQLLYSLFFCGLPC
jgi:hypothetical protein